MQLRSSRKSERKHITWRGTEMLQLSWLRWKCISMSQYLVMNIRKKITTCIYGIKKWIPSLFWVEKKSTWLLFCCLPSRWSRNVTRPCNLWRTNYPIISNTIVLYNQIEIQWAMFVWWIYYKVAVVPWTSSTRSSNLYSNQRQNLHQNPLILTNLLEVKSNLIKQWAGTLCRIKHILIQYHGQHPTHIWDPPPGDPLIWSVYMNDFRV